MIGSRWRSRLASRRTVGWAAVAAILLSSPCLFSGLEGDDFIFLADTENGAPATDLFDPFHFRANGQAGVGVMKARGELPWWVHDRARLRFWRPITSASHHLDFSRWPEAAWLMHLQNVAWYVTLVFLAAAFYRRALTHPWAAGLAVWLYALDDAHATPVGWITARNTVMSAAMGVASVLAHDRWRRDGWRAGALLGPAFFLLAILCGEGGLAFGGYLVAHAVVLDGGPLRRRLGRLWPYGLIVVAWRLYYVLHDYGVATLGIYRDPGSDFVSFAVATIQNGVILCATQFTLPLAQPTMAFKGTATLVGIAVLVALALGFGPTLKRHAGARLCALGMVLSTAPFGATEPADRLLMPVGLGAFGLFATFVADLAESEVTSLPRRALASSLLGLHLVLAPLLFVPQLFFAAFVQGKVEALDAAIPSDGGVQQREIVILQSPQVLTSLFLRPLRQVRGVPYPATVLPLYAGESSLEVERIDSETLEVRPRSGFLANPFESMFRSAELPFAPGERQQVGPMVIEIRAVTESGRPEVARFHFDGGLEAKNRLWMSWRAGRLLPWSPPQPGRTVVLRRLSLLE